MLQKDTPTYCGNALKGENGRPAFSQKCRGFDNSRRRKINFLDFPNKKIDIDAILSFTFILQMSVRNCMYTYIYCTFMYLQILYIHVPTYIVHSCNYRYCTFMYLEIFTVYLHILGYINGRWDSKDCGSSKGKDRARNYN